jgi:Na+-transporting methylmalonyl-CoA/oxaloacetate decarboxylase gamma subunit
MTLLQKFADPNLVKTLTFNEKVTGALYTAVLGMGITFAALVILWGAIILLSKMVQSIEASNEKDITVVEQKQSKQSQAKSQSKNKQTTTVEEDEISEEMIAVITAAIAKSMDTSSHNIVVRDIRRVYDDTPIWGQTGRAEQLNSRL